CLTRSIKSSLHLGSSKRAVAQQSAVLSGERNALGDTLIDDAAAYFSKPVHIGFPGTVISPLNCIVKQTVHAVAVVLVILGCIDTSLRGNGVRASRRILK